ncbi:hypothetical protein [Pedobacter sp. SG908]|uniref:hypothetical protein n=1 Tax=Pedobacter sp. SG908 TaxID=2587135 RepID=UPI001424919D|nr:hypothetical protein [Pedobacter sp. SG908]NII81203.1 hypothetical protein [Pedobacter sp. SG908]
MDIILTPSLFERYFTAISKPKKDTFETDLVSLLQNNNNRFVLSNDTVSYINDKLKGNPLIAFIQPFFTNLIDDQVFNVESDGAKNEDDILDNICRKYEASTSKTKDEVYTAISYRKNLPIKQSIDLTSISQSKKIWAIFQTCCYHPKPLVMHYFDFDNNEQIFEVISGFFSMAKANSIYYVLDRQCNLDHDFFSHFQKVTKTHYYTAHGKIYGNEKKFKDNFKSVFIFCGDTNEIHERKLICDNFILETDEDFWNIEVDRTTWKIDFTHCSKIANKLRGKVSKFTRKHI